MLQTLTHIFVLAELGGLCLPGHWRATNTNQGNVSISKELREGWDLAALFFKKNNPLTLPALAKLCHKSGLIFDEKRPGKWERREFMFSCEKKEELILD